VLKKGQLLKRGKAGTIFGDRYAVRMILRHDGQRCFA
jgi:hypothetical protein